MVVNLKALMLMAVLSVFAVISVNTVASEKITVVEEEITEEIVIETDKIAVVDTAVAIFGSAAAQAQLKQIEESAGFLSLKAKYESSFADFQAMAKEAESKRFTWSQEQVAEHQKKMGYAKADSDLAKQKIKAEQQQLQQRILKELGPLAEQALQEIVKEQGIAVLLRAESVLIADPEADLTARVAERIDQKVIDILIDQEASAQ